jgi:hypothetical protein
VNLQNVRCNDKNKKPSLNLPNICILSIYTAPSGNFAHFLDKLEMILNLLHSNNTQIIICGDIKYLVENKKKNLLDSLMASYNLISTVYFPTRIQNNSVTAIDSIFINVSKFDDYTGIISPLVNGLSDHDAQLITINE